MKKLGKLRLNKLNKSEIEKREMNAIRGGVCSCAYAGDQCSSGDDYYGGSSNIDNAEANGIQLGYC